MLLGLALLAPWAILGSEMRREMAWPMAVLACGYGLMLARNESRSSPRQVIWSTGIEPVTIDAEEVAEATVRWRGRLAFLSWQDRSGRMQRLTWWPDRLPPAQRRELKLAVQARAATPAPGSMAP